MARKKQRRKEPETPSPFDQARDEMFQQIIQCGVLEAAPDHQREWFDDTMGYLAERYHELTDSQIAELRTLGMRFCDPPKVSAPGGNGASAA